MPRTPLLAAPLVLAFMAAPAPARADSPLTSTVIHQAYGDLPLVVRARAGQVDQEMADFLKKESAPLDHRIAIVNALGLSVFAKPAAVLPWDQVAKLAYGVPTAAQIPEAGLRPDELTVVGYALALGEYTEPRRGAALLEKARKKLPTSFTVGLLAALTRGQAAMNRGTTPNAFCSIWRGVETVLRDPKLVTDMRDGGVDRVMDYVLLYRESCPGAR